MIEINLLPGGERKAARRGAGFKLPSLSLPGMPTIDRMMAFVIAAWILGPLLLVWLIVSANSRQTELDLAIQEAQADSARYAQIIAHVSTLRARRDTIAEKLQIIQEIDSGRYIWAHLMDQISMTLPEYTWVSAIRSSDNQIGGEVAFQLDGRTGNNFALTEFLRRLEASPFIRNVTLVATEQVTEGQATVYSFSLTAAYQEPPAEAIETVPLFVAEPDQSEGGNGAATE
ncbi:MAG: PilN domain-containing protein [Longimicrobiales bacterium]